MTKADTFAYSCPTGYYCNTDGGWMQWWYKKTDNTCANTSASYPCSGTDSSCTGFKCVSGYSSQADCIAGINYQEICQYCCDKSTTPPCTDTCSSCALPSCPTGYTSDSAATTCRSPNTTIVNCNNTGNSCPPSDGCGSRSATCYLLEANTTPSMPASVSIIVDGVPYQLSTNPATPTRIKLPSTASDVQLTEPTTTPPGTSNGVGYAFRAYNDGVNSEWSAIAGCSGVAGEDFCIESTLNTQDFVPSTKTLLQVLKENAKGKIAGMYYTINKCDTNKLYSLPIEGYYVVDYIPVDDTDIELSNEPTVKNCVTTTYTGLEANNPLPFTATISDSNGNSEIESLIVWFSKDTSYPSLVNITSVSPTEPNINDFGVMIRKSSGSWSNTPITYITNANNTWASRSTTGKLTISNVSVIESGPVQIKFDLLFSPTADNPTGMYNVYGGALDSYMINSNVVDQGRLSYILDWGIDLVNPSIDDTSQSIQDVSNFLMNWTASESGSSLKTVVLNGYRAGGTANSPIELFAPTAYTDSKGFINAITEPTESEIGKLGDYTNGWEFVDTATYNDLFTDGWYNNNWLYRRPVTVANSLSTLRNNEDVLLTIDTKDLIDNGKLQNDCGDLRFLDNNDDTKLTYWIENGCNTPQTYVWVRIPTFPAAGKTIYMYYGNPSISNGTTAWSGSVTMLADATCPSGWTRNTDFDNRFPYGSTTSGTTGGIASHDHGTTVVLSSSGGTNSLSVTTGATGTLNNNDHTHNVTISVSSISSLPPYLTMMFCKNNSLDLPSGLITMFDSASLPSGWARFASLDSRFPYGGVTYGATGGSSTHTHTLSGAVSTYAASTGALAGTGRTAISGTHSHTLSGSTSAANSLPPYLQVLFAKTNGSNDLNNAILMVDSVPPIGWSRFTALDSKFPYGGSSYGATGGSSAAHTHTVSPVLSSSTPTVLISSATGTKTIAAIHSHTISSFTSTSVTIIPPYNSTIFATRKNSEFATLGIEMEKNSTWHLVGVTNLLDVTSKIDIGNNEGGDINMYVTAYDQGCNASSSSEDIDLNPWITTYGGTIYSTGGITNSAKDVSTLSELDGVFLNVDKTILDTGTEVISGSNDSLPDLIHPTLGAVMAKNIYDSNDKKTYWFDYLKEKFAIEKSSSAREIATPTSACSSGICYVYSEEDINIANGFECSSKLLIMSEKDIHIQPDITNSSASTGCIFVAKGNIYIGAGTYKTGGHSNVRYDYINAFLIAQGKIEFELADQSEALRDGIEISGGLVAFGNEITSGSALSVVRNLKLLNVTNPTVVIRYNNKYPNIASQFFGLEAPIYKQEIGFKSF